MHSILIQQSCDRATTHPTLIKPCTFLTLLDPFPYPTRQGGGGQANGRRQKGQNRHSILLQNITQNVNYYRTSTKNRAIFSQHAKPEAQTTAGRQPKPCCFSTNTRRSTKDRPRREHAYVISGACKVAAIVEILDLIDGTELGRMRTVFPRQVPDVLGHGTVWSHALSFGLKGTVVWHMVRRRIRK